jgi:hypothetical protein
VALPAPVSEMLPVTAVIVAPLARPTSAPPLPPPVPFSVMVPAPVLLTLPS